DLRPLLVLHTRRESGAPARLTTASPGIASPTRRDLGEGPYLEAARPDRARAEANDVGPRPEVVMIIVDRALKARAEEGKPIRVGMIGAGFMAQGLTNQIENSVPGMRMAASYNHRPHRASGGYRY